MCVPLLLEQADSTPIPPDEEIGREEAISRPADDWLIAIGVVVRVPNQDLRSDAAKAAYQDRCRQLGSSGPDNQQTLFSRLTRTIGHGRFQRTFLVS